MLTQIATWKLSKALAIQFTVNGIQYSINHVNIPKNRTNAQLETAARNWMANRGITLPEFHIHRNRDNSFCLVFGPAPAIWPEDMV